MEEKLSIKHTTIIKALATLARAITQYKRVVGITAKNMVCADIFDDRQALEDTVRDSLIQRFEFCVDTFWKYYKTRLEATEKIRPEYNSPRGVFRALCTAQFISEKEAEQLLVMVDARNASSHRYKEEMAQIIAQHIPQYYDLMHAITTRHTTIAPAN